MQATAQISTDALRAVKETAVFLQRPTLGVLKITGESRLDLIDRMSTQAVKQLQSGQGAATIFTTDIGRIIDRILLYASSDTVYALTSEEHADPFARYLMRFVFFNDDFHLEDISQQTAVFAVYGAQAAGKLSQLGFPDINLPLHHWQQVTIDNATLYLHATDPIGGAGYFVMAHANDAEAVEKLLKSADLLPIDEEAYDYLRIVAGHPRFGREIRLDYIPLEANMWDDVSFNKGCYTGQEIIARMESRGKVSKQLIRFTLPQPIEQGTEIVAANGRSVGSVTSVGIGPEQVVGMGYVKTAVLADPNAVLTASDLRLTICDLL